MQYRQAPLVILTKFYVIDGFLSPFSWYRKVGLRISKSRKFRIFGKNLLIRDKSPWANFTKLSAGEGVPGQYVHAKVHSCAHIKNVGLQAIKSPKFIIFGKNFPQRGISLNRFFIQNLAWGGSPRPTPSCQISPMSILKRGHAVPKIGIFGIQVLKSGTSP